MRFQNLQALRGAACLVVVVYHVLALWAPDGVVTPLFTPIQCFGFGAVDVFFVLSGFVITWVHFDGLGDRTEMGRYLGRRLWRVYPLYWLAWPIVLPLMHRADAVTWLWNPQRWPADFPVLRPLALVPSVRRNMILPQSWTLTLEVLFYVTFAVFFLLPRRAFLPALGLWFVAVLAVHASPVTRDLCSPDNGHAYGWWLNLCMTEFVSGCALAVLARRGWIGGGRLALASGIAGFALVGCAVRYDNEDVVRVAGYLPVFLVPSVLLVYGLVAVERRRGWRLPGWLRATGDASYPIYLMHLGVCTTARRLSGPSYDGWRTAAVIALALAASLAAGFAFHLLVERPVLAFARRRRSGGAAFPATVVRRAA